MIRKIEHIGVAVRDIASANQLFRKLLGSSQYKTENVESEGVTTSFFMVGDTKIELLVATGAESPVAKFIERRGEGLHHIAFEVDDIEAEMGRLKGEGFELLSTAPKDGADNKKICFLHPKSTQGVLVELCEERKSG
jgi:methylmalonyl-CoA/ethylmalonyl-CoA epimerase